MAQTIRLYGVAAKPLKLRTATWRFRYVVVLAHWQADRLVKYASSDNLATATRRASRAVRERQTMVAAVVDLRDGSLVAVTRGALASYSPNVDVSVTGSRGR